MEFAIIAGFLGAGYTLSSKGATPRTLQEKPPLLPNKTSAFPFESEVSGATLLERDVRRTRKHVERAVKELNVNYPDAISERTGHFESQRRMEMFTGAEETWNHKREAARHFDPTESRGILTSGGTIRNETRYDSQGLLDRAVFGTKMHNVMPFEQHRVGPGVGVGPEVPSIDGFHSQFRIMPTDAIDATRINQLPGRAPSGAALTGRTFGGRRYDHFEQKAPSLVEFTPGVSGARGMTAPSWHPDPMLKPTKAEGTSRQYVGGTFAGPGPDKVCFEMKTNKKQLSTVPGTRSSRFAAPMETNKAYTKANSKRTSETPGITGTNASVQQAYVLKKTRQTPRKLKEDNSGALSAGASAATVRAGSGDTCWVLKDTNRESMGPCAMPGAQSVVGTGSNRMGVPESSGLREFEARNAGESSYLKKTTIQSGLRLGPGRETLGRTEIGGLLGGVSQSNTGQVQGKVMTNAFGKAPTGNAPFALQRADAGCDVGAKRKVPSEDPRSRPDGLGLGLTFGC